MRGRTGGFFVDMERNNMMKNLLPSRAPWLVPALMVCSAGLLIWLYYPTLHYGFRGEEFQILYLAKHSINFYDSFISHFLGTFKVGNFFYRPIPREFSYFVMNSLFGPKPLAFRCILFALFFANTLLVYLLIKTLCKNAAVGLVAAVFFATRCCHFPLMYWILFGFENLLLGCFIFSAVLAYIGYVRSSKKWYLILCSILNLLALMTKESAVIIPVYCVMVHLLLEKPSFRRLMITVVPIACITALFVGRILVIKSSMSGTVYQPVTSLFELGKNVLWYMHNCFNNPVELTVCGTAVGMYLVFFRNKNKLALFGLVWFFVSLVPFVTLKRTGPGYLYIPVFGLSTVIALSIQPLLSKIPRGRHIGYALVCGLFVVSNLTGLRKIDFQESEQFITGVLKSFEQQGYNFPDNALIYIKGRDLPAWKSWILGQGKAFMLKHENISVYFESWGTPPPAHPGDIFYFTLSDNTMKFLGRYSNIAYSE